MKLQLRPFTPRRPSIPRHHASDATRAARATDRARPALDSRARVVDLLDQHGVVLALAYCSLLAVRVVSAAQADVAGGVLDQQLVGAPNGVPRKRVAVGAHDWREGEANGGVRRLPDLGMLVKGLGALLTGAAVGGGCVRGWAARRGKATCVAERTTFPGSRVRRGPSSSGGERERVRLLGEAVAAAASRSARRRLWERVR